MSRRDSSHPVFCGCIDWHSCVHGIYALLLGSRLIGATRWRQVAEGRLKKHLIDEEVNNVATRALTREIPYGYAWLLKLAIERERNWSSKDLRPLGCEIVKQLRIWLLELTDDEVQHLARSQVYGNISWALQNLWLWAQWVEDEELTEELRVFARHRILPLGAEGAGSGDRSAQGFFAPGLQMIQALISIMPPESHRTWLDGYVGTMPRFEPVITPKTMYSAGLNFNRSWGFWSLFKSTGDLRYRDLYVDHILTQMNSPQYWRNDYRRYGHWVPQFGVHAIALSMENLGSNI